jgi:hypothetical protein
MRNFVFWTVFCLTALLLGAPMVRADGGPAPAIGQGAPGVSISAPPAVIPTAEYTVYRTRDHITLDGVLDEDSWRRAVPTPSWMILDGKTPATNITQAKILWDDERLYIGINVADTDVRASYTERDDPIYKEDCVEFFVMEQLRKEKYPGFLEYEINAKGGLFDAYDLGPLEAVAAWDSKGWRVAVKVDGTLNDSHDTDKGWTVEMSIPFFDLYGTSYRTELQAFQDKGNIQFAPKPGDRWRANFYRVKHFGRRRYEYIGWSPTLLNGFHVPARFGTLIFSDSKASATPDAPPK